MATVATTSLTRQSAQYDALTELSEPLVVPLSTRTYNRQYASLYDYRLRRLKHPKGRLVAKAQDKWGSGGSASSSATKDGSQGKKRELKEEEEGQANATYVKRILDVKQGQVVFVIGTVYVSMHLKPDVLEDLTREQYLPPQPVADSYADPSSDEIFVEDESGRVRLVGDAIGSEGDLRRMLITGVVVALLGTETRSGDFEVADAIFAGVPPPQTSEEDDSKMKVEEDGEEGGKEQWVALVSGLEIEATPSNSSHSQSQEAVTVNGDTEASALLGTSERELRLALLSEWLQGEVGSAEDRELVSKVTSLVIAGNSISTPLRVDEDTKSQPRAPIQPGQYPTLTLDNILADVASTMHIHLLPGASDPTSIALPQQPIHFALLPKTNRFDSLHRETNPAWFGIGGKKFMGTSGQNIDDIYKYVVEEDGEARLRCACRTLDWGHVAPTAPDTLACYPLADRDPFLIEDCPDVYFVGNQPSFGSRVYYGPEGRRILVLLLPKFSATGQVILVQPHTLQCKIMSLGIVP